MARPAPVAPEDPADGPPSVSPDVSLNAQERAVLIVLLANTGRVIGRRELSRHAGLTELNERRCDSVLVGLRRILGAESIVTVRSRGWRLAPGAVPRAIDLVKRA